MTSQCPLLIYRKEHREQSFDTARAFCTATDSFVQPMRADICNNRYGLTHTTNCEIYDAHQSTLETDVSGAETE